MDYLLKCYFDQFSTSPRNTLHDRRNRRHVVDYISTLIEGYTTGSGQESPESTVEEAVSTIIKYHQDNLEANGSVCKMGRFHNILYVGLRISYIWQLRRTPTVTKLLEDIYLCEGSFERVFIGAIFGSKASHYIAGWKSDFDSQEENLRAIVFFVEHAVKGQLSLCYDTQKLRFLDVPVDSCGKASPARLALQLGLPDKLLIFLRFGAVIEQDMVEYLMETLAKSRHVYPHNLVSCLRLVLRVVPCLQVSKSVVFELYTGLVEDGLVPLSRCGVNAPDLKHLARCVIRGVLWRTYQLPQGIRVLPLPESLKNYLDVLED